MNKREQPSYDNLTFEYHASVGDIEESKLRDDLWTEIAPGDQIKAEFMNLKYWKRSYQRNYRKCGGKNLRCFPYCKPVHLSTTFCGDSVKLFLQVHQTNAGTEKSSYCAFAEFSPVEASGSSLTVGQVVSESAVLKRVSARREEVTWWPGMTTTSELPTLKTGKNDEGQAGIAALSVAELSQGAILEFNQERRAWHYGYVAGKTSKSIKHCFRVYVLSTNSVEKDSFRCEAIFTSPAFELYGRKSKSSRRDKEADATCEGREDSHLSFDSISESFDSDSFDFDFDGTEVLSSLNDLDQHLEVFDVANTPSISRKRSFLDYEEGSVDDKMSVSVQSLPAVLKKPRSESRVSALDSFLDDYDTPLLDELNEVPFTSKRAYPPQFSVHAPAEVHGNYLQSQPQFSSGLSRCASAPQMRPKMKVNKGVNIFQLNDPRRQEHFAASMRADQEEVTLVLLLFKEITHNKSNDKFINIITKFLLSENETLSEVIHSSIKETLSLRANQPTNWRNASLSVLKSCYKFLETNFPPFRTFCAKKRRTSFTEQLDDDEVEGILATLVKYQYGYVPRESLPESQGTKELSYDMLNFMGCFRGRWMQEAGSKETLSRFYTEAGIPEALASCVAGMEWSMTMEFESDINTLVVKRKDKLFCSGMVRYVFDGRVRRWTLSNPFLSETYNIKEYDTSLDLTQGQIMTNYYLQKHLKFTKLMQVVNGVLEVKMMFCERQQNGTWVERNSAKVFARRGNQ